MTLLVRDYGTIVLLGPLDLEAHEWFTTYVRGPEYPLGSYWPADWRCAAAIIEAFQEEGGEVRS